MCQTKKETKPPFFPADLMQQTKPHKFHQEMFSPPASVSCSLTSIWVDQIILLNRRWPLPPPVSNALVRNTITIPNHILSALLTKQMLGVPKDDNDSARVMRVSKERRKRDIKENCCIIIVSVEEALTSRSATETRDAVGAADFAFEFVIVRQLFVCDCVSDMYVNCDKE